MRPDHPRIRPHFPAAALLYLFILTTVSCAGHENASLTYRGIQPQPTPATAIDQNGQHFKITGMSGITWAGRDTFWGVMDNSDKLVRFEILFNSDGSIQHATVTGGLTLADRNDNEGIAFTSEARNSVWVSEENTPGIHEYSLADGAKISSAPIPEIYLHGHTFTNQGFESLTRTPDGREMWTANGRALIIDGNPKLLAEPFMSSTCVRLLRFAVNGTELKPTQQYVYQTSGVHHRSEERRV